MIDSYNYIKNTIKDGDIVVVSCSFGPDSMALLNLVMKYRKTCTFSLIVAHVNHKVRKESDQEYKDMEKFCKSHKIIFEGMCIENYSDDNFHNESRNIRYHFCEEIVKKYNATYLMTAHHGDDLIETILMRIVRGSTLAGYAGFSSMIQMDGYKIFRPLIYTTKVELIDFDKKNKIPYAIDKTNFLMEYTRNRYRKVVLPFLKEEDKNVHKKFLKYSNTLFMYENYINKEMKKVINDVYKDNIIIVDKFKNLDLVFQDKIIYSILENIYQDDLLLINDVHVNAIKNLIFSNRANCYLYLPNDFKVIKSYNEVCIKKEVDLIDSYEIQIDDTGYVHLPNDKIIEVVEKNLDNSNFYCRLNTSDITLPLHIRTRKSGDRIFVKGLGGNKKVKDIFINSKIKIEDRDLWPILVDSKDKVLWIPGIKKSKFDIPNSKNCDIILWYH